MNIKRKSVLCYCFVILMLSACSEEKIKPKSDLSKINTTGDIQSIKETQYKSLSNFKNGIGLSKATRFNKDGNKESISYFNADGSLSRKTVFTYQDNFYLDKEVSSSPDNKVIEEIHYVYDTKGRLLNKNFQKNTNQNTDPTTKNEFFSKFKYEYDGQNNKKLELTYNSDATLDSKATYGYDDKQQLVEENWLYADGVMFYQIKNIYANTGKKKSESRYRGNGKLFLRMEYDEKGDLIIINEYDPNNKSEVQSSVLTIKHQYEYDDKGNWIIRKTLENAQPSTVTIRKLEYVK